MFVFGQQRWALCLKSLRLWKSWTGCKSLEQTSGSAVFGLMNIAKSCLYCDICPYCCSVLLTYFQSLDFRLPTDIQAESIPLILGGGDVLMVSLTYVFVTVPDTLLWLQLISSPTILPVLSSQHSKTKTTLHLFDILTERTNQVSKLLATTLASDALVLHLFFFIILFFSRRQKPVVAKQV